MRDSQDRNQHNGSKTSTAQTKSDAATKPPGPALPVMAFRTPGELTENPKAAGGGALKRAANIRPGRETPEPKIDSEVHAPAWHGLQQPFLWQSAFRPEKAHKTCPFSQSNQILFS
jgi:hypothetical protein